MDGEEKRSIGGYYRMGRERGEAKIKMKMNGVYSGEVTKKRKEGVEGGQS